LIIKTVQTHILGDLQVILIRWRHGVQIRRRSASLTYFLLRASGHEPSRARAIMLKARPCIHLSGHTSNVVSATYRTIVKAYR
jgi:hypothetical protein